MRKSGFTLLEVVVAMLILSLVMVGLVNVFVGSKRYLYGTHARMTAGELARYFLDPLQLNVSQSSWSSSWLGAGGTYSSSLTLQGITYTANYNITTNFNGTTLSRVQLNLTWNETAF